jgi:hypothetical protein
MKIKCGAVDCKHNSAKCNCKFKGTVELSDCYYHTTNGGFQHFWRCKQYEKISPPLQFVDFENCMTRYQDGDNG